MQNHLTEQDLREAVALVEQHGSVRKASVATGVPRTTMRNRLQTAYERYGLEPNVLAIPVPEGYQIVKSTLHVKDGEVVQSWPRVMPIAEDVERFVERMVEHVSGKAKAIPVPRVVDSADIAEIIIGDPHAGMYAWANETGDEGYDLDAFRRLHTEGPAHLLGRIGRVERLVLAYLGDLFHTDNRSKMTERSGNVLDTSARWGEIINVTTDTTLATIELAARQCQHLDVVIIPGNHDWHSSQWLQRVLAAYFRRTPHIHIVQQDQNVVFLEHEKILLGYTHGDRVPAARLQGVMSHRCAEAWGRTTCRYWRCGHFHQGKRFRPHWDQDDASSCIVEYFPSLAPLEAYSAEMGLHARRAMIAVRHNPDHGEIARYCVTPGLLKES